MTALGIVDGFWGTPWEPQARRDTIAALAPAGYSFYIYAPKLDDYLRGRWREPYPPAEFAGLTDLARHCRAHGMRFGLGFSPFELYRDFDEAAQSVLAAKLSQLMALKPDIFAILFDDMRGDVPGLAETQARIADWIAARVTGAQLILCPTYYTDESALDRFFGERPKNYLEDLGRLLDPAIDIFWTGPEVCSREFTPGHLDRVAGQLRRKPFLWDNYPVNDGPRMSPFLYLRAFTGRPAAIADHIAGHAVNPALQPTLTRIPMLTLAARYRSEECYDYGRAFTEAAEAVCGRDLARALERDLILLHDTGLDRLEPATREKLRVRYAGFDHPAAREVVAFLDGKYRFAGEFG